MKNFNTVSISTIITLIGVCIVLFIFHRKQVSRLKRASAIESAKADFIRQSIPAPDIPFDSVYAKNDTIAFYKNKVLVGKSIFMEE
jgi:hypothetical protein